MTTEKEKRIIALNKEGKTSREISEQTRSSFGTISKVLKMAEDEEKRLAQKKTNIEEDSQAAARYRQAMEMLSRGKSNIDIVKKITGMKADEMLSIQTDYWRLNNAEDLARIYAKYRPYLSSLLRLYERTRQENIDQDDLVYSLKHFKELRVLNNKIFSASDRLEGLQDTLVETQKAVHSLERKKQNLESVIKGYENKVLHYREKFKSFRDFEDIEDELDKH
jgi:DNA repair ATPase RecN